MEPSEIWAHVASRVRQEIADPTVWLAMRATQPLLIDGNFFVAGLPPSDEYLSAHLLNHQATSIIEEALREAGGRILAFRLIVGTSAADWAAEKMREAGGFVAAAPDHQAAEPPPAFFRSDATPPPTEMTTPAARTMPQESARTQESAREVAQTWDKLSERLSTGYKSAPYVKYAHGQAQFVLTAVKLISDTMDVQMPAGKARDDAQERLLAKVIERLSGMINLDALFIALELLRYREQHGKNADITL